MQAIVILDKSSKHFSKFIELLKANTELKIKDVKKIVSHSTYYAIVIKKLYSINKLLREIDPDFYLAEPSFSITKSKSVFASLKRCEKIEIDAKEDFFILRCNNGKN